MQELRIASGVHALSFSSDGRYLAISGAGDGHAQIVDLVTNQTTNLPSQDGVYIGVAFASRGQRLATWSDTVRVYTWNGTERTLTPQPGAAGEGRLRGPAALDPTGDYLVVPSAQNTYYRLQIENLADPSVPPLPLPLEQTVIGSTRVTALLWSPNGESIGVRGELLEQPVLFRGWVVPRSGNLRNDSTLWMPERTYSFAFSPDGQALAFALRTGIRVVTSRNGDELYHQTNHQGMVTGVAYLPDGRLLSCGIDSRTLTSAGDSGRLLDAHDWQVGELTAITVAPDGMKAAVGSKDGRIFVWDLD